MQRTGRPAAPGLDHLHGARMTTALCWLLAPAVAAGAAAGAVAGGCESAERALVQSRGVCLAARLGLSRTYSLPVRPHSPYILQPALPPSQTSQRLPSSAF
jgi:hypothetical protein